MFKKAVRRHAFVRIALMGPAGSGKTTTALLLAKYMGAKKIAVIDSERGSAKLFSHICDFDVCELESFAVERYMDAIAFAQREGYDFLIIDSLSHAWAGKDGILEYKDKRTEQSRSKDSFGAGWRDASPLHTKFIDAILAFKGHVISTLRVKMDHVVEEVNGKKVPRKIGLAPVQREGVEYEFTVVGDFIDETKLAITKTRIPALKGQVIYEPGREMAQTIIDWLNTAEAAEEEAEQVPTQPPATPAPPKPPAQAAKPAPKATPQQDALAFADKICELADAHGQKAHAITELDALFGNTDPLTLDDATAAQLVGTREAPGPLPKLRDRAKAGDLKPAQPAKAEPAAPTGHPVIPETDPRKILIGLITKTRSAIARDFPNAIPEADKLIGTRALNTVPDDGLKGIRIALENLYEAATEKAAA